MLDRCTLRLVRVTADRKYETKKSVPRCQQKICVKNAYLAASRKTIQTTITQSVRPLNIKMLKENISLSIFFEKNY